MTEKAKRCSKCGQVKAHSAFYKRKSTACGCQPACKECSAARAADYYLRHRERLIATRLAYYYKHRESALVKRRRHERLHASEYAERLRARRKKNPLIPRARGTARRHLSPEPCSKCGSTDQIHAHHDDYNQPLDVVWLCHVCHSHLHAILRRKELANV